MTAQKPSQAERVSKYLNRKLKRELYAEAEGWLSAHELEDGDLLICLGKEGRRAYRRDTLHQSDYYEELHEILRDMLNGPFDLIAAEDIGALTDCYLILGYDLEWPSSEDRPIVKEDSLVWWYGDYMIKFETEELAFKGYVILNKA